MDNRIISLLNKIREKPGLYIGRKSILNLWHFVNGYAYCLFEQEGVYFNVPGFQDYIEDFYHIHGVQGWANIIQFHNMTEEGAFDSFYRHLDEYLRNLELVFGSKEEYLVYLFKEYEDNENVIYKFSIKRDDSTTGILDKLGRIQLDRKREVISQLSTLSDVPSYVAKWASSRAGFWLTECNQEGVFPDKTEIDY